MSWWKPKKPHRGKHALVPGNGQVADAAVGRAAEGFQETIMNRPTVDNIVLRIYREFGTRP